MKRTFLFLLLSLPVLALAPDLKSLGMKAAQLRGLSYTPIASQMVSQKECSAYLVRLLDKELVPQRTRMKEGFLKTLGLMEPKMSLRTLLVQLYSEQVRGLYDPAQKRYLVVSDSKSAGPSEAAASSMAAGLGLSMTDVMTVHELEHAIQDQHFNLAQISKSVANDSDHEFAAQSVIEGDATLVMMNFALSVVGMDPAQVDPASMGLDAGAMGTGDSPTLERAPRYFKEMLTLPYTQGMVFCSALKKRGGWKAVDAAFKALPPSSEQIFHPERYGRDQPKPVSLESLPMTLGGYQTLGDDTGGEFTMRVWAEDAGLPAASVDGWGGDRYRVYANASSSFVVWSTLWDNPGAARRFESLAGKALARRWGAARAEGERKLWTKGNLSCQMESSGTAVKLCLAVPNDLLKGLAP